MQLPLFTKEGLLPPGDFVLSLAELRKSMLVSGPPDLEAYPHWDAAWRGQLEFPSAFRQSRRDGKPRGIVRIGG